MKLAAAILIDGVIDASWLFIVAVGLTLVFGVLNILNFAHGSLFAVGAYAAASAVGWYYGGDLGPPFLGYLLMLGAALAVALVLGPLLERGVLRFFYRRDEVVLVLVTYALFLILEDATKLIWGVESYYASEPYGFLGNVSFFGLSYVGYDFALIGLALVAGIRSGSGSTAPSPARSCWRSSMTATSAAPWASMSPASSRSRSRSACFWPRSAAPSPRPRYRCSQASASRSSCSALPSSSSGVLAALRAPPSPRFLSVSPAPRRYISCPGRSSSLSILSWRWCWHCGPRGCSSALWRGKSDGRHRHACGRARRIRGLALLGYAAPNWFVLLGTLAFAKGLVALGIVALMRGGLVSFGQGTFYCAGAYAAGMAMRSLGIGDAALLVALGALAGLILGLIIAPLLAGYRGIFFATLTLALSMIVYGILNKTYSLGGSDGLNLHAPTFFGYRPARSQDASYALFVFASLVTVIAARAVPCSF